VPADIDDRALEAAAFADETVRGLIADKAVRKVIVVAKKLISIFVAA
jgi:hypothetical protein